MFIFNHFYFGQKNPQACLRLGVTFGEGKGLLQLDQNSNYLRTTKIIAILKREICLFEYLLDTYTHLSIF